jgi:hypothetical protein
MSSDKVIIAISNLESRGTSVLARLDQETTGFAELFLDIVLLCTSLLFQ